MFTRHESIIVASICIGLVLAGCGPARAAGRLDLDPGPHAVGFKTMELYDFSRVFREKYGPGGVMRPGERSRPVLVYLWYPAEKAAGAPRMVYGEYSFASPANTALFPLVSRLQEREIYSTLYPFFGGQRGSVVDLMNVGMSAVRDAKPLEEIFPAIVYHTDMRGSAAENALLCEYLASHGYVVATSHSIGTMLRDPAANLDDLETLVRDKEFVIGELRRWPQLDGARLGLVGNAFGGLTALVLGMRNADVDAVVTLGEWTSAPASTELAARCREYRPSRMTAPILAVFGEQQAEAAGSPLDSLPHSTRYLVAMPGMRQRDFLSCGALSAGVPGAAASESAASYGVLCRTVRMFLDGHFKGSIEGLAALEDAAAGTSIAGIAGVRIARGVPAPLREDAIVAVFWEEGVAAGIELLGRLRAEGAAKPLPEATLNTLGYHFLAAQRLEEAVEIFRAGSEIFPGSANAWASLGEACAYAGRADEARGCFEKTLELLSIDTALDERMREALKTQAEGMLKRLGR